MDMADLILTGEVADRLRELAEREGRSVDEVVRDMMKHYPPAQGADVEDEDVTPTPDPLTGLVGLLDEFTDATDLSSTVRDTLRQYTHPKYGWTRRDRTD
jgi:hypothetical protein